MTIASGKIRAVHVGTVAPPDGDGVRTAYVKRPVEGARVVHALGIEGDVQANRRVHGGPEKAVYGYPLAGYAGWRADFPEIADRFGPGAMGENLVIEGQDEANVHIGDLIRAGTALLQVAQIREPCSTFTAVIGTAKAARAMTRSGRCGWYYRVVEPGMLAAGDDHAIVERPNPDWPVARMAQIATGKSGSIDALAELVNLPGLTADWRQWAARMLARQRGDP